MISTLELSHFRGLEHVKFENLGRANLIVGGNNTGKTSILEALVLLYGSGDQILSLPTTFRDQPGGTKDKGFWNFVSKGSNPSNLVIKSDQDELIGTFENGEHFLSRRNFEDAADHFKVLKLLGDSRTSYKSYSNYKLSILAIKQRDPAELSNLFNQVAPLDPQNEEKLEKLLHEAIEPRLRRLRYAKPKGSDTHLVYVDLGSGQMLPFTQLGQAFGRTLQVYCEIFANRPKILLVDEIENGLYFEGLEDYWKGLMAVLEDQDVQLFATTHSRECMEAAQRAAASMEGNPLRFLRLDRRVDDPQEIVATTFGQEEMQTAINSNLEMR